MASRCLGKLGSRVASRLFISKPSSLWTPSVSANGVLLAQRKLIHTTPCAGVNKGPEGAPPQRFISGIGHILFYLAITAILVSYPSYIFYNMDDVRPHVTKTLGADVQEEIARRKELRAQGVMPVLQTEQK